MKKIEDFARKKAEKCDYNHDFDHVKRTVKWARYLAKKEKADVYICVVAAWLHDIEKLKDEDIHGGYGAETARVFLKKLGFNKDFIERVAHCIYCHDGASIHNAKTIEAKVVFDADKLQAQGAFGFVREFSGYSVFKKLDLKTSLKISKKKEFERYKKYFQTKTGKKFAKEFLDFMQKFYKQYEKEDKVKFK